MARIYPLFSSSKGNAHFVGTPEQGVLIDCGVSFKRLETALFRCRLSVSAVQGVFITHEHSDHVQGLKMLLKKGNIPVYAQEQTLHHLREGGCFSESTECHIVEEGKPVSLAGMQLFSFSTPHDTAQSCGYRIVMPDGRVCAVCTDLGHVSASVSKALSGCDLVLLEANYDPEMLRRGNYPDFLKERIASDHGHLSNAESAKQARILVENGTTRLILAHLSQENNTPALAENAVLQALQGYVRGRDYLLDVAGVETKGEMMVF